MSAIDTHAATYAVTYAATREHTPAPVAVRSHAERFAEALRPRLMGPRLAAALGQGPGSCHVLDAKYEPGVRALILYAHGDALVRGDLLPVADGPARAADDADPQGSAIVAPGVRICTFPHDPELASLPLLMDPARLGPVLAAALPGSADGRRTSRCRVALLRYRPGKRATVRVTSGRTATAYVVKAYHDPKKAAAVAEEAPRLAAATASTQLLRLAPVLAHVPEPGLVIQAEVPGVPLDALVGSDRGCPPGAEDGVRLAARALAELHESRPVSTRQRSVERELHRFGVRADRIATVDAELGVAAARLARRLTSTGAELPAATSGLVHGDCKPSQFLLSGRHAYLLDLDHVGISDQATDVGTFLATLRQLATRHALAGRSAAATARLAGLATVFLEAYVSSRGDAPTRVRVQWQEAVALERKAQRAFARAPGAPLAAALVAEAHRSLDQLGEAA